MCSYDPRWGDDPRDRDRSRDRHDDGRSLGRGGGSASRNDESNHDEQSRYRYRDADAPSHDRERGERERDDSTDPRDVFMRDLNLPHGQERDYVFHRGRTYKLRGSETRTLSTVGAFRVVSASDLRDAGDRAANPRSGDLRHLREEGLIQTVRIDGHRDAAVVLTDRGRDVLESHRSRSHNGRQVFYAGIRKARELEHDAQIYGAYLEVADRLQERGARIERVGLDYELKREYQQWLHERNRGDEDCDGRPDRDAAEVEVWAREHDLPYFDEQIH